MLADWDAGGTDAFVAKMNGAAQTLALHSTHITDPSGLDSGTVSTPSDLIRLGEAAMAIPTFRQVVAMPQVTLPLAGLVYTSITTSATMGSSASRPVPTRWRGMLPFRRPAHDWREERDTDRGGARPAGDELQFRRGGRGRRARNCWIRLHPPDPRRPGRPPRGSDRDPLGLHGPGCGVNIAEHHRLARAQRAGIGESRLQAPAPPERCPRRSAQGRRGWTRHRRGPANRAPAAGTLRVVALDAPLGGVLAALDLQVGPPSEATGSDVGRRQVQRLRSDAEATEPRAHGNLRALVQTQARTGETLPFPQHQWTFG